MCMFGNMFKTHFVAAVPLRKMPISSRKSGGFCHHIWIFLCGWWEEVDSSLERVIKTRKRGFPSWLESRAQAVRRERLWVLGRPAALILLAVEENQYLNLTVVLCTAYITWFKYQCLVSPGKCCGGEREVWVGLLGLLPPWPGPRSSGWGRMDVWCDIWRFESHSAWWCHNQIITVQCEGKPFTKSSQMIVQCSWFASWRQHSWWDRWSTQCSASYCFFALIF